MSSGATPDLSALLEQAQRLQEQLVAAKDDLARTHVEGSAASGLVQATVTGTGELVAVTIKPDALDVDHLEETAETLGDMVVAAVRDATDKADELAAEQLGPLAGGLGGPDEPGGGPQAAGGPAGSSLPPA